MIFRLCSSNHHYRTSFIEILALAVFLILSSGALAQDEFFLPNTLIQGNNNQHLNFSNLNNMQLIERAHELRSQDLNATQRALNHQWLESHRNQDFILGSKAYQTFFKRGFKEFWNRQRKERFKSKYVPDIHGRGAVSGELDYDVRFSSDGVKLGLTYEF